MYCSICNSPLFIWFYVLCVMIMMKTQLLAAECKDEWANCSKASICRYSIARRNCKKTCGLCEGGDWKKKALKLAYDERGKGFRLEGVGLTSIPPKIPAEAEYVFLKDNKITHITNLGHLKSLETLEIPKNQIKDINAQTFKGLLKLRTLDLAENQISSIPANTFATLKYLYSVVISKNQISSLPAGIFAQCPTIGNILLQNNKLTSLSKDVFSGRRLAMAFQRKFNRWAMPLYVGLRGNPLVCDSTTKWIKTYAASKRLKTDIDPCSA